MNLSLKLKQNPIEETDLEWIEAHIENDIFDGKPYIGKKEIVSYYPNYFSKKTLDERDKEILEILTAFLNERSDKLAPCGLAPCENFRKLPESFCVKYTKMLGDPPRKTAKCKNMHDYFSAVNACHKIIYKH